MSTQLIEIADRKIGADQPCFIIAEAGVNHNGDLDMARRLVDIAVDAGANAVKFQTLKADNLVARDAPKAEYQMRTSVADESHYDMIKRLELSAHMHQELIAYCSDKGITFLSSPFDEDSADLLDDFDVPAFKIPSGEIVNLPFLAHVARKGKPMIVSTGMAYLGEVEAAVRTIRDAGNEDVVLLHCVSNYPADVADVNLKAMHTMGTSFGLPVGYSDHTIGVEAPFAAVALGACIIEKHFTFDRHADGPDHLASMEPDELVALVRGIRMVEATLGDGIKRPAASEANTASVARKSLVAACEIPTGTVLTEEMVTVLRPGTGLPPVMREYIIGRTMRQGVSPGALLTLENLD